MGFLRPKTLEANDLVRFHRLIETGTSTGQGAERMAPLFKEILTVELDGVMALEASKRLRPLKHVRCYSGESSAFLHTMIDPNVSTLFFLDAHYVHYRQQPEKLGYLPPGTRQSPLLAELAAIFSFEWVAPYAILIDDLHMLQPFFRFRRMSRKGYNISEWPTQGDVTKLAGDHGCGWRVIDDMLLLERK